MKNMKEPAELSTSSNYERIPRSAVLIYTIIAAIVFGIGIYHFTQPEGAWRSGTIEVLFATLLLAAAYLVHWPKTIIINLIAIVLSLILGIYHLTHGGGWRSGITELFLALVLILIGYTIYRHRKTQEV